MLYSIVLTILMVLAILYYLLVTRKNINNYIKKIYDLKNKITELDDKLKKLDHIDPLTDVLNRNRLDIELQMEFARIKRSKKHMGVMLVGIDNIKDINDKYAKKIGDQLLVSFSSLLKVSIRKIDILGRWRGDRFLIICAQIDSDTLATLAEKLRIITEEHNFQNVGRITASFGLTISVDSDDELTIIDRVEIALKNAKKSGKNQISLY